MEKENISVEQTQQEPKKQEKIYYQADVDNLLKIQQDKNKELQNKFDTLSQQFNDLQNSITERDRVETLRKIGIKQEQMNNVKKLTADVPLDQLEEYISKDSSFDIFRTSKIKPKEQEQQQTTKEVQEDNSKIKKVFKRFM